VNYTGTTVRTYAHNYLHVGFSLHLPLREEVSGYLLAYIQKFA